MQSGMTGVLLETTPPERVMKLEDLDFGLEGAIVVHSTALGPALGGCRFWHYPNRAEAQRHAVRLAAGMSAKYALAGLPLGGGKAVIRVPEGAFDRKALFAAFGRAVEAFGGAYVTAEDVGTSGADMVAVRSQTGHVAGLAAQPREPAEDPSAHTARGVFEAMKVAAAHRLGRPMSDVTVAVQGLGKVGFKLCCLLHDAGARLTVSEPRSDVAARAAALFGAEIVRCSSIYDVKADIFAPCALDTSLDHQTVLRLRTRIVCGAANNQLADPAVGKALADRDVLYAPDYLVNAGGIISVAGAHLGWMKEEVARRVSEIAPRFQSLIVRAEQEGESTDVIANLMVRDIITAAARRMQTA